LAEEGTYHHQLRLCNISGKRYQKKLCYHY
jgi:hypothetical protein